MVLLQKQMFVKKYQNGITSETDVSEVRQNGINSETDVYEVIPKWYYFRNRCL